MFNPSNKICPLYHICQEYCPSCGYNATGFLKVLEGYLCRDHNIVISIPLSKQTRQEVEKQC